MMKRFVLTLALTLLAFAGVAAAQDGEDPRIAEARAHFETGERAFDEGSFALARTEYEQAMSLMEEAGHPGAIIMLYNIALANFELGNDQESRAQFQRYLDEAPADAPHRDAAQRRIQDIDLRAGDTGGGTGPTPQPGPGPSDGGGGGEVVSPVGVVIASVGAATAIAGAVVGGLALANSDAARADCTADMVCPEEARADIADAQTLAYVADGLLFGGLAVAATGVVLMFVLADGGGDDASASAMCTPDGCGAVVRGVF